MCSKEAPFWWQKSQKAGEPESQKAGEVSKMDKERVKETLERVIRALRTQTQGLAKQRKGFAPVYPEAADAVGTLQKMVRADIDNLEGLVRMIQRGEIVF